jgi:hypothetical protein
VDSRGRGGGQDSTGGGQERQRRWTGETEEVDRRGRGGGQERKRRWIRKKGLRKEQHKKRAKRAAGGAQRAEKGAPYRKVLREQQGRTEGLGRITIRKELRERQGRNRGLREEQHTKRAKRAAGAEQREG